MKKTKPLEIHDLIQLKWNTKIVSVDQEENNKEFIINDRLYQKLCYLVEERKAELEMSHPRWEEIRPRITDLEDICKNQYEIALKRKEIINKLDRINKIIP